MEVKQNYLDKKPCRTEGIQWSTDEAGMVTLAIENTGVFNKIAQKLFKKPRISYVHLDETGSFIWPLLDGEKTVFELGKLVEAHFGDKMNPLYERLSQFIHILDSYQFISFK